MQTWTHERHADGSTRARVRSLLVVCVSLACSFGAAPGVVAAKDDGPTSLRPRVGLALGGGSARGMAHAGVLQWMEEHHVPVDRIAGNSTGALMGASYATGLSAAPVSYTHLTLPTNREV